MNRDVMPHARFMPTVAMAGMLALASGGPAVAAAMGDEVYRRINEGLTRNYLVPRYQRFAEESTAFGTKAHDFCAGGDRTDLEPVRAAFGQTMDAWMGVQHIGFGPAELFMRGYRVQFWPQARGKFAKAVEDVLAADDASVLAPENFRNASVAAQGLPAAEELLYSANADFGAEATSVVSRCALLEAVAVNIADMAEGLVADWTAGAQPFADLLQAPGPENGYFQSPGDVTLALFKSLYAGLELIQTAKLDPVLGASTEAARPTLAESPLSGRSLRNIVLNLRSLRDMYEGGGAGFADAVRAQGDAALDELMRKAFRLTIETAESVQDPFGEAVRTPAARARLEKLATQVQALKQIVRTRLANALDLGVGFNALDGD